MDIQATKLELIQLLMNTQEESLLMKLKEVFIEEDSEKEIKKELIENSNASLEDIKNGKVFSLSEAKERINKHLK